MGQIDSDSCHSFFKQMNQHLCITACWSDGSVNFCLHYTLLSAQLLCCAARDSIVRQILPPLVLQHLFLTQYQHRDNADQQSQHTDQQKSVRRISKRHPPLIHVHSIDTGNDRRNRHDNRD